MSGTPWDELENDPDFIEGMARADRDIKAGHMWSWGRPGTAYWGFATRGLDAPSDSWKPDDPVQPDGWYHDGRRWRLKRDGGWFKDDSGFWRYNHPGDPGWTENPDGSWRYVKAA